ncbi:MAG: hypothetical protein ACK41O_20610, partial [Runella zeae]
LLFFALILSYIMFRLLVILLVLFIHESFAQAIPEVACFGDVDALATTWDTSATVALKGTRFTPSVVNQSSTAPILFESTIEGQPSEVKIELADKSLIERQRLRRRLDW